MHYGCLIVWGAGRWGHPGMTTAPALGAGAVGLRAVGWGR